MPKPLRIKFLSKTNETKIEELWAPLIPTDGIPGVQVTFDPTDQDYDFLAVYEGLPKWESLRRGLRFERLACSRSNTLLITTEPSSIRIDGPYFMRQFGHVLTSKSPVLTKHPNHIAGTPPLRWFYGRTFDGQGKHMSFDNLLSGTVVKTKTLSTVCSDKRMSHTVHAARLDFVMKLRERLPELNVYGRGIRSVSDKANAMRAYRYHIAIENHIEPGHWTEKLADCFLARCLPFYFGDPDYAKIFPERSVVPINIFDIEAAVATMRDAINNDEFARRQDAIQKAREIVLNNFNTITWVARFAQKNFVDSKPAGNERIYSRHAFRRHHPLKAFSDFEFRTRMKHHPTAQPLQMGQTNPRSSEP